MDERAQRLAVNEVVVREANEVVGGRVQAPPQPDRSGPVNDYLCACLNLACLRWVALTAEEYEHVRSNGKWFLVAPDHVLPEIEDIVEQHDGYWIVSKRDDAGEIVTLLDPRHK